jgi:hypothetical protein
VGTNVSFRSVYNGGQFQLCMMHAYMYLLYAMANMTQACVHWWHNLEYFMLKNAYLGK